MAKEKNVTEFTQFVNKLCLDKMLRLKMGQNARKYIENNFSQIKLAPKQIALYERVLFE
jgi:hypothetical protein